MKKRKDQKQTEEKRQIKMKLNTQRRQGREPKVRKENHIFLPHQRSFLNPKEWQNQSHLFEKKVRQSTLPVQDYQAEVKPVG